MSEPSDSRATLAIMVGGGPAPGINSVIAAATIEAINSGLRVIGLRDGFRWLVEGDTSHALELRIADVSRIHLTGGSILRTSRTNPARNETSLRQVVEALEAMGVRYPICIGVVTVPRTIDNGLPLPENAPTCGFETARSVGSGIIEALMEDARTTGRWYLAVSMGRKSGALALAMGKAAGASLAIIPEEFGGSAIDLELVVDTICGAIIKRKSWGRDDGVALVAEGLAEHIAPGQLSLAEGSERDPYGHLHLADIPLGALLREKITATLEELGLNLTVVAKDIGYEMRCAKPVPFDVEYTRTLGYGAVRYLLAGGSGALIAITGGRVTPV